MNLLRAEGSFVFLCRDEVGKLAGYAVGARLRANGHVVSWVTQLVVHTEHQNQGIASTLLGAAWCFSDDFAWGLATANPYAVRALEAATGRRCDPELSRKLASDIGPAYRGAGEYLSAAKLTFEGGRSALDTKFFVSHAGVPEMIKAVSTDIPWTLGELADGEEWFAVTFREQVRRPVTMDDLRRLEEASSEIVADAYDRMAVAFDDSKHLWTKHTQSEVAALWTKLHLIAGATVLDLGCGNGRHSTALASRGAVVTAVDRSKPWLDTARERALQQGCDVRFVEGDARVPLNLGPFDSVICLYDVVGSFVSEGDNRAILEAIASSLKPGGTFALSVMNRQAADEIAHHKGEIETNPNALMTISPSSDMEQTGQIWNPDHLFLDVASGVVYRRERFTKGGDLPIETIVRDRRFYVNQIVRMCIESGLLVDEARPVRLGYWADDSGNFGSSNKEILVIGHRTTET